MIRRLPLKQMKIRSKLILTYVGLTIPFILIGALASHHLLKQTLQRGIESELRQSTDAILNLVKTTASASIKNYLRAVAEKNLEMAHHFYRVHKNGGMPQETAVERIREVLLSQTIGETGYIYCVDSQGVATVHPRNGVEGRDYSHFEFVRQQTRQRSGYIEYEWQNPGETSPRPKALYMAYFEPFDWIISVSTYREEFASLINVNDFRQQVLSYRFGDSGYAYIVSEQGDAVIHPELDHFNILEAENTETDFFEEMRRRKSGTIVYRWQNPSEDAPRKKLVIFGHIPEYRWLVASSCYIDEVFGPLKSLRNLVIAITLGLVAGYIVLASIVSAHLTLPVERLIETVKSGAEGNWSVRLKDGSSFEAGQLTNYFNIFMQRIEDYHSSLNQEIQSRKAAQEQLEQSESRYRLLADNVKDVIWMVDMELNYTFVSPSCEALQGWTVEEFLQMNLTQSLPSHSLETAAQVIGEELAAGAESGAFHNARILELELNRSDGSTIWAEITGSFLLDDNGQPMGILGVARDISERKATEAEMTALQERLARSKKMEALGLLAGGVAHDLNNVLSGIVSYPDLLLLDLPAESTLRAPILAIRESGHKAAAIVQDLLTLARRGVTSFEVVSLNTIVRESLSAPEHKKLASLHPDIRFDVHLEKELPKIKGSAIHLKKCLSNLLSNATEAQPGGGGITITTESRYLDRPIRRYEDVVEGEYVVLIVGDSGEGIDPNDISRIFEPFYTKKVMGRSGTGLGMAVVWGTVQDHRGYIDVISTIGDGTTFELYFPLTREQGAQNTVHIDPKACMGQNETILVVDDIKEQRELAAMMLGRLNYNVFTVSSGEKAIAFLENHTADLVVLDMIMDPGMDGLETFRAIRSRNPEQSAIIASGYAETERVKAALQDGAGRYLKKPYTLENLAVAVRGALSN